MQLTQAAILPTAGIPTGYVREDNARMGMATAVPGLFRLLHRSPRTYARRRMR